MAAGTKFPAAISFSYPYGVMATSFRTRCTLLRLQPCQKRGLQNCQQRDQGFCWSHDQNRTMSSMRVLIRLFLQHCDHKPENLPGHFVIRTIQNGCCRPTFPQTCRNCWLSGIERRRIRAGWKMSLILRYHRSGLFVLTIVTPGIVGQSQKIANLRALSFVGAVTLQMG